jgi:DNA-binding protein H-NS
MQDLSKYSIAQLRALEVQVIDELKTRHFLGISQAREQILHIARSAGISVEDLLSTKAPKIRKQSTVKVKYRNPDDPTQQWSGRGRQPAWVKDWIESGKSLEEARA